MPLPLRLRRIARPLLAAFLLAIPAGAALADTAAPTTSSGATLPICIAILVLGGVWLVLAARWSARFSRAARQPAATGR